MNSYVKAALALLVAVLAALTTALTGKTDFGDIDAATWLVALGAVIASGALTAFVSNVPGVAGGIMKAVIASLGAAVASLITALDDNLLSREEQITALSAFVVGLSLVYQIPNAEPEPAPAPTAARAVR